MNFATNFIKTYFAIIVVLLNLISYNTFAQSTTKKVTTRPLAWYNYLNILQLSPKATITTQVGERQFLDNGHHYQIVAWSKFNYSLGSNWDAGIAFAYVTSKTFNPASTSSLSVPELRPFEELNYKQKISRINIVHRYRLEERYIRKTENDKLIDGYNFNFRFRYQLTFEYNLYKSKDNNRAFSIRAGDEIILNAGKTITHNVFDQNRIFASLYYQPSKHVAMELGYMNAFQERSSGMDYYKSNIYRLSVFHTIRLYRSKS